MRKLNIEEIREECYNFSTTPITTLVDIIRYNENKLKEQEGKFHVFPENSIVYHKVFNYFRRVDEALSDDYFNSNECFGIVARNTYCKFEHYKLVDLDTLTEESRGKRY